MAIETSYTMYGFVGRIFKNTQCCESVLWHPFVAMKYTTVNSIWFVVYQFISKHKIKWSTNICPRYRCIDYNRGSMVSGKWNLISNHENVYPRTYSNFLYSCTNLYNYLCNHCLSPLKLWVRTPFMPRCTRYNIIWYTLSVTCDRLVVFSRYSGFLHQ
jgi:hypothetical protein